VSVLQQLLQITRRARLFRLAPIEDLSVSANNPCRDKFVNQR
jgi:hypothetical protein